MDEVRSKEGSDFEENANEDESLTPPLLPNMKIKVEGKHDDIKTEKEVKSKRLDWDMFADEHSFKKEHNVSYRCQFVNRSNTVKPLLSVSECDRKKGQRSRKSSTDRQLGRCRRLLQSQNWRDVGFEIRGLRIYGTGSF